MRALASLAVLGLLASPALAADLPEWAYPVNPPPKPVDEKVQKHLPGSTKAYTQAQIDDGFNPPDWYPQDHPPMPEVVLGNSGAAGEWRLCHDGQCQTFSEIFGEPIGINATTMTACDP